MQNSYLAHYGVKGMRWGVRRAEKKAAREAAEAKLKAMSDEDLRRRLSRIQMEKQYKTLTKRDISKGKNATKAALKIAAKTVGKGIAIAGVYGGAKYFASKYKLSDINAEKLGRAMEIVKIVVSG